MLAGTSSHPNPPEQHPLDLIVDSGHSTQRHTASSRLRGGDALTEMEEIIDDAHYGSEDAKTLKTILLRKLGISFFLFGLINNLLYVIILSAALDLVPPSTPKGIIAFCNIAPSLCVKATWPYLLKGRVRYVRRLTGCCILSVLGMVVVSLSDGLYMRLLGIAISSFSSGMGEMTFVQLTTTYALPSVGGHSVGYFASGTGAAGLVGAFFWWGIRGFGVRTGVGISSIMPFVTPLTYFFLLPRPRAFEALPLHLFDDEPIGAPATSPYAPIPTGEDDAVVSGSTDDIPLPAKHIALSIADKLVLLRPMLHKYMLPLFCVYLLEYTINQGIAPTLLYPVPDPNRYWLLSKIIHSVRDYYPLWQLVYQINVFLSRSTISLGIPPLPEKLLPLPAILQFAILLTLAAESAVGLFAPDAEGLSVTTVFVLVSIEGICGGLAYVNVFYRANQECSANHVTQDPERMKQEREFKMGSIGLADSFGIMLAAVLAVPTEIRLCRAQVRRGKTLCQGL